MQKPRTLVAGRLPAEAEDRKRLRSRAVRVRQGPPPFRRAGRNRRDPASSQNAYHFLSRARAHARPGAHHPRPDDHGGGLVYRADPPQTPPLPLARTHAHARRGSSEGTPPLANVIALGPGRHKAPGDERGIEGPDGPHVVPDRVVAALALGQGAHAPAGEPRPEQVGGDGLRLVDDAAPEQVAVVRGQGVDLLALVVHGEREVLAVLDPEVAVEAAPVRAMKW